MILNSYSYRNLALSIFLCEVLGVKFSSTFLLQQLDMREFVRRISRNYQTVAGVGESAERRAKHKNNSSVEVEVVEAHANKRDKSWWKVIYF